MFKKFFALTIIALAVLALSGSAKSQTMYFCEGVTSDGYPTGEASTFNIGSGGGYLDVLTRLPYSLNCSSVRYEIYRNGEYDNTIYQDTQTNWDWFYKQITFYKSGSYTIYLIDCYDITLASGTVRIQFR
jgi:hypothetical protein